MSVNFKQSRYTVITPPIDGENCIIYSTRTSKSFIISKNNLENIRNNDFNLINPETFIRLLDAEIIINSDENELEKVLSDYKRNSESSYEFGLTIQPSGNCQLGCTYCGQDHKKLEINDSTFNNIISHVKEKLQEKPYKIFTVTWYGAEPLMSLHNIHRLSEEFLKISAERGLRYNALMITNGLSLKPNIFEILSREFKIDRYQITLDGDEEFHDKSRFTKKGLPSFNIIYRNIIDCVKSQSYKETNSKFLIRCNITKENSAGIKNLLNKFAYEGIQDKIAIELAPVHDWGGNNADQKGFTRNDFADLEIEWILHMKDLGFKIPSLIPKRRYNTCMVTSGDSAELIDANGNITYCWETTYTPGYSQSEYIIGNINKEEKYYDHKNTAPLKNWYDKVGEGYSWCKDCNLLPVCGGACPISWAKGQPACPSFKFNIQDKLILEYLILREHQNVLTKN